MYANGSGFAGNDQFNVTLMDSLGATTPVTVSVQLSNDLRLNIGPGLSGNLRLAWPATATAQGFRLLSGNLVDSINGAVATGIVTDGTESVIQVVPTGAATYYRLTFP